MLQGLVANEGDGWAWFLGQLGALYRESHPSLECLQPNLKSPQQFWIGYRRSPRNDAGLGPAGAPHGRDAPCIKLLRKRPCLCSRALFSCGSGDGRSQIEAQIRSALEALKSKFSTLDEASADRAALLLSKRVELIERSRSISSFLPQGSAFAFTATITWARLSEPVPKTVWPREAISFCWTSKANLRGHCRNVGASNRR